jgi:hypothetical protein
MKSSLEKKDQKKMNQVFLNLLNQIIENCTGIEMMIEVK